MAGNGTRTTWVRRWALAAGVAAALAGPAAAQYPPRPSDPAIDRARALQRVADQRADAYAQEVIGYADKVARTSPAGAVEWLNKGIGTLAANDSFQGISPEKRADLNARLRALVVVYSPKAVARPAVDPRAALLQETNRKAVAAAQLEAKEVGEAVADVERLNAANLPAAARARAADVAKKYPLNPAVLSLQSQGNYGDNIAAAKLLAREQDRRFVLAMNDVQRSALPPIGDIEFPDAKKWHELSKRRDDTPKLAPEDEAILRSLEKQVTNPIKDAPFLETVQTLSNVIGKEIYLDKKSLEEAGLDLQRPVNMPGAVSARTALRAVLQAQGLTFVVKDRLIQVVTLEKAQTLQVTKAYYLGELISSSTVLPGGAVAWGPLADYQATLSNAQIIMDSITQSVDPMAWKARGGPATITFHYPSMSLIVRAPAEVHAGFGGKFGSR